MSSEKLLWDIFPSNLVVAFSFMPLSSASYLSLEFHGKCQRDSACFAVAFEAAMKSFREISPEDLLLITNVHPLLI